MQKKRIGLLTSGGDAPGMNAVIRGIVRCSIEDNIEVIGIRRGYSGLIAGEVFEMSLRTVSDIIHRGGTILYTARCKEFKTPEGLQKAANVCHKLKLDAVVIIGGDGSFRGALEFSEYGINCIGIPATIDKDIACSDYTIGFDTAVNTATEMIDKIRDTAQSNDRCNVVEVMGKNSGTIALHTGIAIGAAAIIVPEVKYNFERDICERIKFTQKLGKKHFVIIVTEGLLNVNELTANIKKHIGIECRATILGHVQRGGSPTVQDRVIASEMACHASQILKDDKKNRIIILKNNQITDISLNKLNDYKTEFNFELYKKALKISI